MMKNCQRRSSGGGVTLLSQPMKPKMVLKNWLMVNRARMSADVTTTSLVQPRIEPTRANRNTMIQKAVTRLNMRPPAAGSRRTIDRSGPG